MRLGQKLQLVILAFVILPKPVAQQSDVEGRRANLKAALQEYWEHQLRTHPELATQVGDDRFNDQLRDYSPDFYEAEIQHTTHFLGRLEAIDTTDFPEQEKLNKILAVRSARELIEQSKFKDWEMPVTQFGGPHLEYPSLVSETPFRSVKDYGNYMARLHKLPRIFEQITANMRLGLRDHLMPPKYLLEKVVTQAQTIVDDSEQSNPFNQPALKFGKEIPEADQKRLHDAIISTVKQEVVPAYAKFANFVRTEYAPKGRTEDGVWALPNGDARYRFAVKYMTTTNLSPEQIHQLGLKQVAEIEREMLAIARRQGYSNLNAFNEHIRNDRKLYATSGQQLLELYQHYADQMQARLPELFGNLPKNKLIVVPMELYRAPQAVPADYTIGSATNGRPGRINVNEYAPERRLLLNVEAIAYHEGVPGHHLQFSIAQELPDLPPFRQFGFHYHAFSEGWAFYSEGLGKDVGFYQDPYSDYGRLGNEMWRSVRLVVDTGVHYKHWSRQQMVDFFRQHTAMDEPNIQTEVDRYIAWPGQALAYKVGQMKILELRDRTRQKLLGDFDIRAFHDAVLDHGALPLDILEEQVQRYIDSRISAKDTKQTSVLCPPAPRGECIAHGPASVRQREPVRQLIRLKHAFPMHSMVSDDGWLPGDPERDSASVSGSRLKDNDHDYLPDNRLLRKLSRRTMVANNNTAISELTFQPTEWSVTYAGDWQFPCSSIIGCCEHIPRCHYCSTV
jgi:uncharacterized protein (DUF885 family)